MCPFCSEVYPNSKPFPTRPIPASSAQFSRVFQSTKNFHQIKEELMQLIDGELSFSLKTDGKLLQFTANPSKASDQIKFLHYFQKKLASASHSMSPYCNSQFGHFIQLDCSGEECEVRMRQEILNTLIGFAGKYQLLQSDYLHAGSEYSHWRTYLISLSTPTAYGSTQNLQELLNPELGESMEILSLPLHYLAQQLKRINPGSNHLSMHRFYKAKKTGKIEMTCQNSQGEYNIEADANGRVLSASPV